MCRVDSSKCEGQLEVSLGLDGKVWGTPGSSRIEYRIQNTAQYNTVKSNSFIWTSRVCSETLVDCTLVYYTFSGVTLHYRTVHDMYCIQ